MSRRRAFLATCAMLAGFLLAATGTRAMPSEAIVPLPISVSFDPAKSAVGEKLFNDVRLSDSGRMACSACHEMDHGGASSVALSTGANGKLLDVRTPSIFNQDFNYLRGWDGLVQTMPDRILSVLHNRQLMNSDPFVVLPRLKEDSALNVAMQASYPDGVTEKNVIDALDVYLHSLITPNAPFDRYLRGETGALTADQAEGYKLFRQYGCISCHQGQNIGGNLRQTFGVVGTPGEYFIERGQQLPRDLGRYNLTHNEDDKFVFRVPSLRNVMLRAPYFHDGSAPTIEDAVRVMFHYQLGIDPAANDIGLIVKFLGSLTGEAPHRVPVAQQLQKDR